MNALEGLTGLFILNLKMNLYTLVDWSGRREDSCGLSWTGETPQAPTAARRLTASPAESEGPGTEINGQL